MLRVPVNLRLAASLSTSNEALSYFKNSDFAASLQINIML